MLAGHGANIVSLDQYSDDPQGGAFFQRTVFSLENLKAILPDIEKDLRKQTEKGSSCDSRSATCRCPSAPRSSPRSPTTACLTCCGGSGGANCRSTMPMVISNHPDLADEVRAFGVPFFHVPSAGPDKSAAEAEHLRLLQGNVDFIVLATVHADPLR